MTNELEPNEVMLKFETMLECIGGSLVHFVKLFHGEINVSDLRKCYRLDLADRILDFLKGHYEHYKHPDRRPNKYDFAIDAVLVSVEHLGLRESLQNDLAKKNTYCTSHFLSSLEDQALQRKASKSILEAFLSRVRDY